jgi:predicted RNA-binding Zn ribbon-like protein
VPNPRERRDADRRRLAWVVRFAQADLATWREGDWLNAQDELTRLRVHLAPADLAPHIRVVSVRKGRYDFEAIKSSLTIAQRAFRALLEAAFQAKDAVAGDRIPAPLEIRLDGVRTLAWPMGGNGPLVAGFETRGGNPDRRFGTEMALELAELLTRVDVDALRRCVECGRWFVADRQRARFDTPACANRYHVRAFTARQKGQRFVAPSRTIARSNVIAPGNLVVRQPLVARRPQRPGRS